MKTLLSCLALLLLAGVAAADLKAQQKPDTASRPVSDKLNENLPKWLRFSGEYRMRFEGFTAGGFRNDNSDAYALNRVRLNMRIQPLPWLKLVFQGQDARAWGKNQKPAAPAFQDTMDLRVGYVEIGDVEKMPVALRAGRQELAFGEERLIGNVNWLNTARSFDAIRATFHHSRYRLDAFAASVVVARDGEFNKHQAGNNLHGLYGGITNVIPGATIEPYAFWRLSPGLLAENGRRASLDSKTVGFRWVGKLPANFDYGSEVALQRGSLGSDDIAAWAGHWLLGYTAHVAYTPRFVAEYNFASGDKDPRDGRRGTFDQLYPTGHDKYGLADQVGWRNIHHMRAGIECKPRAKWLLMGKFSSWWLANSHDALYNASGAAIARISSGAAPRHVGDELDGQAVYTISKQIQVAGGYAYLIPGAFLKRATPGKAYHSPYISLAYTF